MHRRASTSTSTERAGHRNRPPLRLPAERSLARSPQRSAYKTSSIKYNRNRARYDRWLTNKGWRGTIADNRVPPRGAVGEPWHSLSPNTNMVNNRTREMPAASKPLILKGRGVKLNSLSVIPPRGNKPREGIDRTSPDLELRIHRRTRRLDA